MNALVLSSKWCQYFTNGRLVSLGLKDKVHFCNNHLGILYKTMSVNFRARHTSRDNKDLANRTFQELHVNEVWHAPEWNSDYWLNSPLPHIPKITFKSIFRIFCHMHVMQRRHTFQTGDVFLGILTKTNWWIRGPDFCWFSLWLHFKFPIKNNNTLPLLNCIKHGMLLQNIISCNCVVLMYLFF